VHEKLVGFMAPSTQKVTVAEGNNWGEQLFDNLFGKKQITAH